MTPRKKKLPSVAVHDTRSYNNATSWIEPGMAISEGVFFFALLSGCLALGLRGAEHRVDLRNEQVEHRAADAECSRIFLRALMTAKDPADVSIPVCMEPGWWQSR